MVCLPETTGVYYDCISWENDELYLLIVWEIARSSISWMEEQDCIVLRAIWEFAHQKDAMALVAKTKRRNESRYDIF